MTSLADRCKELRDDLGLSQEQLAAIAGISRGAIALWENGSTKAIGSYESAARIEKATGYRAQWLASGTGPKKHVHVSNIAHLTSNADPATQVALPTQTTRIPVVGMARLGDDGHFVELEYPVGHGDGYIALPTRDPNAYAIKCVGDSMKPRIKHGEYVVVEPNSEPISGCEVLVKTADGRVMVKTYLYRREGRVHLQSVNEAHPSFGMDESAIDAVHKVVAIVGADFCLSAPPPLASPQ